MNGLEQELDELKVEIDRAADSSKYRFQPKLQRIIERMEERGEAVPAETLRLNEELVTAAIEAQFDNMPV